MVTVSVMKEVQRDISDQALCSEAESNCLLSGSTCKDTEVNQIMR